MIVKGIKDVIKTIRLTDTTINLGFIRLNFAGGFSKANMYKPCFCEIVMKAIRVMCNIN